MTSFRAQQGVTVIELLIAISILGMISVISISTFSQYRARQAKDAATEAVLSILAEARLDTISSKYDDTYGVLLRSDEVVYFKGKTYPGDSDPNNILFVLPGSLEIANINLGGGGDKVFYERLTGATDNYGTFEVRVKSQPTLKTVITVNQTGASSL